jgi:hypothetical protein
LRAQQLHRNRIERPRAGRGLSRRDGGRKRAGGGVSSIGAIYRELPERVAAHMFHSGTTPPRCTTSIVKSKWGPDSGVRGAARLWPLPK